MLKPMSNVIFISSGKGGSGTTSFTTNLGSVLANNGSKVLICDFNIGLRNDDIYLGMENRILFDMGDVFSGLCNLEKAVLRCEDNDNLFLLPCPQGKGIQGFTPEAIDAFFVFLRNYYDFILIDFPVSVGSIMDAVAKCCDKAVLLVTQDYVSVRNTDAMSCRLDLVGLKDRYLVINKISEDVLELEPSLDWITSTMLLPLAGMIPFDDEISLCNNQGNPIVQTGVEYYIKLFNEISERMFD